MGGVSAASGILVGFGLWVVWAFCCARLGRRPRPGDVVAGVVWRGLRAYAYGWQRMRVVVRRVEGQTGRPRESAAYPHLSPRPGPLIVIANHTAGVDPLLVQAACRFEIRWLMAADMRSPWLEDFWQWARVIFLSRGAGDSSSLRETLRHLAAGGVIGLFPEGGIERPPGQVMRFQHGVGMLVKKSKAPVLPIAITGTPQVDPVWASLWHRGNARVIVLPVVDYAERELSVKEIAEDLQRRIADGAGWPINEAGATADASLAAGRKADSYPGVRVSEAEV